MHISLNILTPSAQNKILPASVHVGLLGIILALLLGCGPSKSSDSPESESNSKSVSEETTAVAKAAEPDKAPSRDEPKPDLEPALALVRESDWAGAEKELRDAISRGGNVAAYRSVLGYVLAEQGDLEGAFEQFKANVADQPDVGENYFNAGSVLRRMGRPADSLDFYSKAGELGAATPEIVAYNQRLALIEMGRSEELDEETAKQLDVENPPGDWIMTAAAISLSRGYISEGAELLATAREKIHPRFYEDLASDRFFRQFRGHPEIVEVLTPPENENPYLAQAVQAFRNSDFPTVVEAAQAAVKAGEPVAQSRTLQGIALLEMEKPEAAEAAFNAAIEADPEMASGYINLGELFRATGRSGEAVATYQRAAEIQPDDPRVQLKIALAMLEADATADVDPSDPAAKDALALARAIHAGDDNAAAAAMVTLRENYPDPWLRTVFADSFFRQRSEHSVLAAIYSNEPTDTSVENDVRSSAPELSPLQKE